ncbi:GP53 [Caviid betaherpesvirus 2]|uniref:GP53 n=2 Tax=Caviid betaherpesvirus 2 TaxID=33706 RepID=U6H9V2_9BETA|nr:GP53 [Caviid betaherpesvirus 2]AGE11532.1 GP53 [Caviid betaherpesvirus 2]AIL83920.1 GP53 [BAC cloning vector GPN13BACdenovo_preserved(MM)]BAJ78521.1 GP53 [Caviid betaherpesvirus 2]CDI95397.1 GP53 [Caviid herpesvirus 2 str. CIDMTR]
MSEPKQPDRHHSTTRDTSVPRTPQKCRERVASLSRHRLTPREFAFSPYRNYHVPGPSPRTRSRLSTPYRDRRESIPRPVCDGGCEDIQHLSLKQLHAVFREFPELEKKYLDIMKMPITGKEPISLPFDFHSHRQYTCLDLSPYGNDQISKSACVSCRDNNTSLATASDAMVEFLNQPMNTMKHRKFYYAFRKDTETMKLSGSHPQLFQLYYLVNTTIPEMTPLILNKENMLHMYLIFDRTELHIPCDCIIQMLIAAKDNYSVSLDIIHDHVVIVVTCIRETQPTIKIDTLTLQRKIDELEVPPEITAKFEQYAKIINSEDRHYISSYP